MKPVRTGLIGCGMISDIYLKNCCEVFNITEMSACADLDIARANQQAEKYNLTPCSVEDLLADNSIEAVINLTVPTAHAEISKKILLAGKHAYSEKPLAVELRDGEELLHLAKESGLRIGAAPDTFLGGGIQTAKKLIDDGWIGKPTAVTAFLMTKGPENFHPNPDFFYKYGGGPMLDYGPYYITAMVVLLGSINKVSGMTGAAYAERTITGNNPRYGEKITVEVPTHYSALLGFDSGAMGTLTVSFDMQYPYWESQLPYIQIEGTEGSIKIPDPNKFEGPVTLRRFSGAYSEIPLYYGNTGNMRGLGFADMLNAIQTGSEQRVSGELSLHVLDVMTGIEESAKSGTVYQVKNKYARPEGGQIHYIKKMMEEFDNQ
jgi:predicted dehydrogenase